MPRYETVFSILYPTVAEIILARNVSNVTEIEDYVGELADTVSLPPIKKWLQSNLRNYLINDAPDISPIKQAPAGSPGWLQKAIEKGDQVFEVTIKKPLRDKIQHVLDYLKSDAAPKSLDRLTVPEALKQSDAWTKSLTKRKVDEKIAAEGEKVITTYPDGFTWRELTSEDALNREGKLMGHCVGSYSKVVKAGHVVIWSLRDSANQPHATLELDPGSEVVRQIKGKGNQKVVEKYHPYIKDILNDNLSGWEVEPNELSNTGLILVKDKIMDLSELRENLTEDPDLTKELVEKFIGKDAKDSVEGAEVHDDGVWIKTWGADTMLNLLDSRGTGIKQQTLDELKELLDQFYDVDFSVKNEDYYVRDLLASLEKKYPKTYEKLMQDIHRVAEETDDEYSNNSSAEWIARHEGELPDIYEAILMGLADGWSVGTQGSAYRYVTNILEKYRWSDGSYVMKHDNKLVWVISFAALVGDDGLGEFETETRREGFDHEFDDSASFERFIDMLSEKSYLVD